MSAEKKIGQNQYRAEKIPARQAQRLLIRVGNLLGPAMGQLTEVMRVKDEKARDEQALQLLGRFFSTVDADDADSLLVDLVGMSQIKEDGAYTTTILDHHLQEDLIEAWQVAAFVLEVQFKDFFAAAGRIGRSFQTQTAQSSPTKN